MMRSTLVNLVLLVGLLLPASFVQAAPSPSVSNPFPLPAELVPDVSVASFTDPAAVDPGVGTKLYYRVTEVDCRGDAGP